MYSSYYSIARSIDSQSLLLLLLYIPSLDLPYAFLADGTQEEIEMDPEFDFGPLMQIAQMGYEGLMKLHAQGKERRKKRRNRWAKRFGLS